MADHEIALNALLSNGLRQRELEGILASNCVLDWFGRTLTGRSKVVNYYLNSNNSYEHSMTNAETIEAFEERSTHLSTRDQPLENLQKPPELNVDEQWYDCETHSPVNLKDTQKTPPHQSTQLIMCPPAPYRRSLLKTSSSDDEKVTSSDEFEEGIQPLDGSTLRTAKTDIIRSPDLKRQRRNPEEREKKKKFESISLEQSQYSDLRYFQVTGVVTVRRQASTSSSRDDIDRRECKMQISYRVNKDLPNDIQIALIVYKNNSNNLKSRRNLMLSFKDDVETSETATVQTPSNQTVNKEKLINTAPVGDHRVEAQKPMKRSISSRNCLRF